MKFRLNSALLVLGTVALAGCGSSGPSNRFDPPNTDFAGALGIVTPPPVTSDQASTDHQRTRSAVLALPLR